MNYRYHVPSKYVTQSPLQYEGAITTHRHQLLYRPINRHIATCDILSNLIDVTERLMSACRRVERSDAVGSCGHITKLRDLAVRDEIGYSRT